MAEPDQPRKETVRIQMPVPPISKPPDSNLKPHATVRIQLPARETGIPPAVSRPLSTSAGPVPVPSSLIPQATVRIPMAPEPLRSSQQKTQPLIAMPKVVSQNPPIAIAADEKGSMRLYWMLLAISALILIIQIWTYFS